MTLDITCTIMHSIPGSGADQTPAILWCVEELEASLAALGLPFCLEVRDTKSGLTVHRLISASLTPGTPPPGDERNASKSLP